MRKRLRKKKDKNTWAFIADGKKVIMRTVKELAEEVDRKDKHVK